MEDYPILEKQAEDAAKRAKKAAGGNRKLGDHLGITAIAVWKWRKVPFERVPAISRLTGIPPHELRPDLPEIFPPPEVSRETGPPKDLN